MEYLIIGLFVAALFHFVYESVVAPSLRTQLRFDLSSTQDELRSLKSSLGEKLDERYFEQVQATVNAFVSLLDRFDAATLIAFKMEKSRNRELRERCERSVQAIQDCTLQEARNLQRRIAWIAARTIAVNNGAWMVFVLPAALVLVCYRRLKNLIYGLLSLPEKELRSFAEHRSSMGQR